MISLLTMIAAQTAVPHADVVVTDAPPSLIWAGYQQCLNRNIDARITEALSPEAIFDASQLECDFWLDAFFAKGSQNLVATNIDMEERKAQVIADLRRQAVPAIAQQQKKVSSQREASSD